MSLTRQPILDVFQRGLIRGTASLPFDPEKAYFYVQHPTEGWRVYLRACCFIHDKEELRRDRFLVVKRAGRPAEGKEWEPPKGQMEGKELIKAGEGSSIMQMLKENVRREVGEEARVHNLQGLRYTGLVLQNKEKDYPINTFFQYHVFQAMVTPATWMRAAEELDWYRAHPAAFARLRRDKREKDQLAWFSPSETQIMGRWSPRIVAMYLSGS
jgi:ADP-ribose pyrophosphatase YjhB (NUDIX family)